MKHFMTNTLSCIIVDDNYLDRIAVEAEVMNFNHLRLLGSFSNALEAMESISTLQPDILFLDINLPDITGLQLFDKIDNYSPACVIITSYPDYASQCFELKVFDYILKPVESHRFKSTVQRIDDFTRLKQKANAYDVLFKHEEIIFKVGLSTVKLNSSEILYLEAFGDYTKIVTENKVYLTLATLSNFLESLPAGKFMRIHRSYVIAVNKVRSLNVKNIDIGTSVLPIGKTYLKEAKQTFK
jgi:DNA-binding LytR/AlgR family response regulator